MKLVLFDIDGTLLSTGRAGLRALEHAFRGRYGDARLARDIQFAGRTDPGIVAELLHRMEWAHAHDDARLAAEIDALLADYLGHLERELAACAPQCVVHPGVRELLHALERRRGRDSHTGLLTGNVRAGAYHKLRAVGIDAHFPFGAFGDDSPDRNQLVPFAVRRATAATGRAFHAGPDVVVIGDTPSDVACARAHGATAIAVCTGPYDREKLAACNPDVLLDDLSDTEAALTAILGARS